MPIRLNTLLKVSANKLDKKGVFNGFIDLDSNFHVDPSLLDTLDIPELIDSREKFDQHFRGVITLLKLSKNRNDKFYKRATEMLRFKEVPYISLGFSKQGNSGSGIGSVLSENLANTGKIIVDAGFDDPTIFELLGLFEKGVGADRISDMTVKIIYHDLIKYTERVARELKINTKKYDFNKVEVKLPPNPYNNGKPIIFLPRNLLRKIPIASSWSDISSVEGYNDTLRTNTNRLIGGNWRKYILSIPKHELKRQLLIKPALLKNLLEVHKRKPKKSYDFVNDPDNEFTWLELANKAIKENPINLRRHRPVNPSNIREVIKEVCYQLKHLFEDNGWWEFIYDSNGKLLNERFAQKLLYGVADTYCRVNNLDLSREPNAGSGPVDFKMSRGYDDKVTLEVKYSSNTRLIHGYETQLPIYNKAERSQHSIYLVIQTKKNRVRLRKLRMLAKKSREEGKRVPLIILIDGRPKKSASKRLKKEEEEE